MAKLRAHSLTVAVGMLLGAPAAAQVDVLTHRYDGARSGVNLRETTLKVANVNRARFGKLAYREVDGNLYAQPLVVSQARVAGRAAPVNVLILATEANSVYAFDADDTNQASTTALLWHAGPLGPPVQTRDLSTRLTGGSGCKDLTTEVGITSTPAIAIRSRPGAAREGVIFVVAKMNTAAPGGGVFVQRLLALDLASGALLGQTDITGSVPGSGLGSQAGRVAFDPLLQLNRPALLLHDDVLHVAFGGHCDQKAYHGWLFAYDVSDPRRPTRRAIFNTTPNGRGSELEGRAGIWMSGQGPAADEGGNVYLATGDGSYDGVTEFGNSVLRLKLEGQAFVVEDWFTPQNQAQLKRFDVDLGAGGALPVPGSHLLLAGGKEGRVFLLDRNDLGRGTRLSLHEFQVTNPPLPRVPQPAQPGEIIYWNLHGSPLIWPRAGHQLVYFAGEEDRIKQYRLIPDPAEGTGWRFEADTPARISRESAPLPNPPAGLPADKNRGDVWMPGGFLSLSADGSKDGTGVLWVTMPFAENANRQVVRGVLRAFDAGDVSRGQLWSSEDEATPGDRLGMFAKFCPAVVANGKVYVAAFQQERIDERGFHEKMASGNKPAVAIYGLK